MQILRKVEPKILQFKISDKLLFSFFLFKKKNLPFLLSWQFERKQYRTEVNYINIYNRNGRK